MSTGKELNGSRYLENRMRLELQKRKEAGIYRSLKTVDSMIDFSSNNYLGLADLTDSESSDIQYPNGSTGSRLLNGNHRIHVSFEKYLAEFFKCEDTLLTNSGYSASLSLLSSIGKRNDLILYDELAHACIKDGARLSHARQQSFRHNSLDDLIKKIKLSQSQGQVFVVVESIYSMDGDLAPLQELVALSKECEFELIVDEAHATGLFRNGKGLVIQMELENSVFARVYTFGKAIGRHGACIAGNRILKNYMVNFARPFIYTTAPSPSDVHSIQNIFKKLNKEGEELRAALADNIQYFKRVMKNIESEEMKLLASDSPIQPLVIANKKRLVTAAKKLSDENLDVRPIFSPTVKEGSERLRIVLHSYNTTDEIDKLVEVLQSIS